MIENLAAVTTMVLAVCKSESSTTMKADIRVDPLGCNLGIDHSRISGCEIFGRELVPYVVELISKNAL